MKLSVEFSIEWNKPLKEPEILRLLQSKFEKKYKVKAADISAFYILKNSLDARKKPLVIQKIRICAELTDAVAENLLKRNSRELSLYQQPSFEIETVDTSKQPKCKSPIIVGAGPAGLFAAYYLTLAGIKPIILEAGKSVEEREKDVQNYWENGILHPTSNVQFGEGGAGTFSDGKLATGVKDPYGRIPFILKTLAFFGADASIVYDAKPHIGTDILKTVVRNMREFMKERGASFYFESQFLKPVLVNNTVKSILYKDLRNNKELEIPCDYLILCTGHSARNTFRSLHAAGLQLQNKPFAVGFRMIHPQDLWNIIQYGERFKEKQLPAADYKITYHTDSGRSFYSFCMCPGGYVVNASSAKGMICCNGMSYHGRNSSSANSALVMNVTEEDYGNKLFDGMEFQNRLEHNAFNAGKGALPIEKLGDFAKEFRLSENTAVENDALFNEFVPAIKGQASYTSLAEILPENLNLDFLDGIKAMGKIKGFNHPATILCGVESRTSSPVKFFRDDSFESNIKGIYPCGEGAGYAGGITSAAMDGLKVAETIAKYYN